MKHSIVFILLAVILASCARASSVGILTATVMETPELVSITLEVGLNGLEAQDVAEFELMPGNQITSDSLASLGVKLPRSNAINGKQTIFVENIPAGVYQIILNGPPDYFREPMGYEFGVSDKGEIINNPRSYLEFQIDPSFRSIFAPLPAC